MPAQGTALGIGSGVEYSNALKGQKPVCGQESCFALSGLGGFSFGSDPQGRPRKRGSPRLGFPVLAPSGRQISATPKGTRPGNRTRRRLRCDRPRRGCGAGPARARVIPARSTSWSAMPASTCETAAWRRFLRGPPSMPRAELGIHGLNK
jgi:hypothetical protein